MSHGHRRAPATLALIAGLILGALALGLGAPPTALAEDEIFVPNRNGNTITVHARTDSGNAVPLRTITGAATQLGGPIGVAVDAIHDEIAVANLDANTVTVYARTATGNAAPLRRLQGAATELNGPFHVVVDPVNDEILVTNIQSQGDSVTVYARTATGNAAPLRTIQGGATGLSVVRGLAVDALNDELLVLNLGPKTITVYPRSATGDAAPLRTIQLAFSPTAIAVDNAHDEILVASSADGAVYTIARTASGNTGTSRTISGDATGLSGPNGVALDGVRDEVLVTNSTSKSVTVYERTAQGNVPPLRTLQGGTTGLSDPFDVALPAAVPQIAVLVNRTVFTAGSEFVLNLNAVNWSPPASVDVYFGLALSLTAGPAVGCGRSPVAVLVNAGGEPVVVCVNTATSLPAFAQNVPIPAPLPLTTVRNLMRFTWPGTAPEGLYAAFLVMTRPGTLDVISIATADFTFTLSP